MRKIMGSQEQIKFNRARLGEDCNLCRRLLHKWWGDWLWVLGLREIERGKLVVEYLQFVQQFWEAVWYN